MRSVRARPETKSHTFTAGPLAITKFGTSVIVLTAAGVEGTDSKEYIGTVVSPKLIQLNCCFKTATIGGSACIRWYVVQWMVDNSLDAFTVPKYLDTNDVNSFTLYVNRFKFRTLKKGSFSFNRFADADVVDNRAVKTLNITIRPRSNVSFTVGGIGTLQKNHVFFFAISDAEFDPPVVEMVGRHLYTDS